ncbi:hypothetical protein [Nitrosomonas communis]|uniref:hypothetical protein n=1 Tax=Nitrosomonas communis TaxID=44574 RepID=UPI003D28CDB7
MMRVISLLCLALAAIAFAAQAEPTVTKHSEPMTLTASQMNNITGGGVTVITHASGTGSSHSASFSITPTEGVAIAASCCGADSTSVSVEVIPHTTRLDPIQILH